MSVHARLCAAVAFALLLPVEAYAQGVLGSLAERVISAKNEENRSTFRLLDAEVLTLMRREQHEIPPFFGQPGSAESEFKLLNTPLFSLIESDSYADADGDNSEFRFLSMLGGRLFVNKHETETDPITQRTEPRDHWGFMEFPGIGPLIGADRRGDTTRWIFFFLGGA